MAGDKHVVKKGDLAKLKPEEFKAKKWERVFYTFFDINRNNMVDWNDFEMLFEKIKDIRGEESIEYRIVSDAMGMVWKGLLMDVKGIGLTDDLDGDEVVTMDEWKKLWSSFNPRKLPIWQWEYVKNMFLLVDTSGDKKIDLQEYITIMKIYGVDEEMSKEAFSKFALDDDGKSIPAINYGQFVRLWNEYFTSGDKATPGNFLFGPW